MTSMINIPDVEDKNRLLFKNNVVYVWARFRQASKMTKKLMTIFFTNPNLTLMQEHLSYKNIDEMRTLFIELLYSKVT